MREALALGGVVLCILAWQALGSGDPWCPPLRRWAQAHDTAIGAAYAVATLAAIVAIGCGWWP